MRKQDWEKRLAMYLHSEKETPFVWGQNDCITFSAKAAIEILEDDQSRKDQLSAYKLDSEETANAIISQYGSMEAIFDRHFKRRVNKSLMKRGDICMVLFNGIKAAGVLDTTGRKVSCKTVAGLIFVPVGKITTIWDIETCPL
jgi:hypothetical protein